MDKKHIVDFFKDNDFSFGSKDSDIKPKEMIISEDHELTEKLKENVFVYDSPEYTMTSFYVITVPLSEKEIFEVRRYIWNEDRYDLYFTFQHKKSSFISTLFYAKAEPRAKETTIKIASFYGDEKDTDKLEKIKKWQFSSGCFWLSYAELLNKIKNINRKSRVDRKLIETLKILKSKLFYELQKKETKNINEITQALIDRTLFIKFLEDNHIINSFFYDHYFKDDKKTYKVFLKNKDKESINKLFKLINSIFNNILFNEPTIEDKYLCDNILDLIYDMITQKDWKTGQLSLFDFRFDIIPVEFIGRIYEAFLEDKQLNEGIFYTPRKLAQLIADDTIIKKGKILDPSCGSGIFLVSAFQRLLELDPVKTDNTEDIIEHKNRLVKDYIFGIEKENTARRISIFSLYLEILRDINPNEIKELIKGKLQSDKNGSADDICVKILPYDFTENIKTGNSLEITTGKIVHEKKTFDYIIGNPPFFQIDESRQDSKTEAKFLNEYKTEIDGKTVKAKDIVGYKQISQCFMLKIKDWAKKDTRFGFVINSSNFYNEESLKFQNFFFRCFQIEKFYELSRVKEILFIKSKESVDVVIFKNSKIDEEKVDFDYYPVDISLFSKAFNLLIIKEDKRIKLSNRDILERKIKLRNYLVGNEYDLKLLERLSNSNKLSDYLIKDARCSSFEGLKRISNKQLLEIENTDRKMKKGELHKLFAKTNYLKNKKTDYYNTPYIYTPENKIKPFQIADIDGYMNKNDVNKKNFQRTRNLFIYEGKKIIFNRFGQKIEACFVDYDLFFSNLIYVVKLEDESLYDLFTAIFNSEVVNYFLSLKYRKRINDNFPKLDTEAINNIPIPKEIDNYIADEILEISSELTDGSYQYEGETAKKLNDLIFDLYDLDCLDKRRIKDFFCDEKRRVTENDLEKYKLALRYTLEMYFENEPIIETYIEENLPFGMAVAVIYFDKENQPDAKKTVRFIIDEILKENPEESFLLFREKIYGKDCIYIVKDNLYKSWTETKAYEDGKAILKGFII